MQIYVAGVKSVKAIVMQDKNEEAEFQKKDILHIATHTFFCKNAASRQLSNFEEI